MIGKKLKLRPLESKNPCKGLSECLDLLVFRLCEIQVSLPVPYRNDTILREKLLNAIKDVDACR